MHDVGGLIPFVVIVGGHDPVWEGALPLSTDLIVCEGNLPVERINHVSQTAGGIVLVFGAVSCACRGGLCDDVRGPAQEVEFVAHASAGRVVNAVHPTRGVI